MLSFVFTDAAVALVPSIALCVKFVRAHVQLHFRRWRQFHHDTLLIVLANGASGARKITKTSGGDYTEFCRHARKKSATCSQWDCWPMAKAHARRRIEVRGAPSRPRRQTGRADDCGSPLVKTAIAGGDPNWGRILAAAGPRRRRVQSRTMPKSGWVDKNVWAAEGRVLSA